MYIHVYTDKRPSVFKSLRNKGLPSLEAQGSGTLRAHYRGTGDPKNPPQNRTAAPGGLVPLLPELLGAEEDVLQLLLVEAVTKELPVIWETNHAVDDIHPASP